MLMRDRGLMTEQISPAQCLPSLSKFIPFTAEWESSQQLSGAMG